MTLPHAGPVTEVNDAFSESDTIPNTRPDPKVADTSFKVKSDIPPHAAPVTGVFDTLSE